MTISFLDSGPRINSAPPIDTFDRNREADRPQVGPRFDQVMSDAQQQRDERSASNDSAHDPRQDKGNRADRQEVADRRVRGTTTEQDARDASERGNAQESRRREPSHAAADRAREAENAANNTANDAPNRNRALRSQAHTEAPQESEASGHASNARASMTPTNSDANVTPAGKEQTDGTSPADVAQPSSESLQAITLGPHLNVITPTNAAPSEQSLEAFARSQGLDEKAVKWLMGGDGPSPLKFTNNLLSGENASPELTSDEASSSDACNAGDANTGVSDSLKAGLYGSLFIAPVPAKAENGTVATAQTPPPALTTSTSASSEIPDTPLLATTSSTWTPGTTAAILGHPAGLISAFAALMPSKSDDSLGTKSPTAAASAEAEGMADLQNSSLRMPPPAPVWLQQIKTAATLASAPTSTKAPTISVSDLDLSADISQEVIDQLTPGTTPAGPGMSTAPHPVAGTALPSPTLTGRNENPVNTGTPPPAQTDSAQRSENIQNLATKMGQAVGERILSEIEKGQWHLKLQLRPATLGHIEVEMRMRSGEMDATFTAPQALTRELLQEGMSRLKDTMSQMGMNVANLNIGDGQTQQRGGESTPRSSAPAGSKNTSTPGQTETMATSAPRAKNSADGLDVLV